MAHPLLVKTGNFEGSLSFWLKCFEASIRLSVVNCTFYPVADWLACMSWKLLLVLLWGIATFCVQNVCRTLNFLLLGHRLRSAWLLTIIFVTKERLVSLYSLAPIFLRWPISQCAHLRYVVLLLHLTRLDRSHRSSQLLARLDGFAVIGIGLGE